MLKMELWDGFLMCHSVLHMSSSPIYCQVLNSVWSLFLLHLHNWCMLDVLLIPVDHLMWRETWCSMLRLLVLAGAWDKVNLMPKKILWRFCLFSREHSQGSKQIYLHSVVLWWETNIFLTVYVIFKVNVLLKYS